MKKVIVCWLMFVVSSFVLAQSATGGKEEKLQQLKSREDIKVTEVEPNLLKLEYPNGKILYKNIDDYQLPTIYYQQPTYSPTYDSTIIDLTNIDTTLYYNKYKFWQEVPLTNFDFNHLMIGDVNNNGKTELYGSRKFYETPTEPICIYELDNSDIFKFKYQYDSAFLSKNIYDIDEDGNKDVQVLGYVGDQRFFSKENDTSFATILHTSFYPYEEQNQLNDQTLGDFDKDGFTDLLFLRQGTLSTYIYEFNPIVNNFDSVYRFDQNDFGKRGFSIGDFDLDNKTDMVFGTVNGNIFVLENEGNNQYTNSWQGSVASYNAYYHTGTNDIDQNGKREFWVMANAFYNGIGITRITIFETSGDNSYHQVGRVDLIGVFSFYAGTMQAIDIDNDGVEEVAICIDDNFLILKFNGSKDHHTYKLEYIKQAEQYPNGEFIVFYGATMNDLLTDGQFEILISMVHIIEQTGDDWGKYETRIYKPDSTTNTNEEIQIPFQNALYQNYPSPFNPTTNLKFSIGSSTNTTIKVFNLLGKEITTLLDKYLPSGGYIIQWDGKDDKGNILPGGVYFIQMIAGSYHKTIKTILLK